MWLVIRDGLEHTFGMELQIQEYGEHALSQSSSADAVTYLVIKYENERFYRYCH